MGKAARSRPANLPAKLKQIREDLNLTQKQMIARLGFSFCRTSLSAFERGKLEPPFDVLLAFARAANIYVEVLIDDQLELPAKLPSQRKSTGIPARKAQAKKPPPKKLSKGHAGNSRAFTP